MASTCLICKSPIKKEIDNLIKEKFPLELIAEKYFRILKCRKGPLLEIIKEHKKKKHIDIGVVENTGGELPKIHTYDSAAEQLLQDGMNDDTLKYLSPEKKLKLAATMKKVDLEGKKLQLGENALKLQVARFLGGFLEPPKTGAIETEGSVPSQK